MKGTNQTSPRYGLLIAFFVLALATAGLQAANVRAQDLPGNLYALSGTVTTTDGEPIADASLLLVSTENASFEPRETVSAEDGSYAFDNLPAGDYLLTAEHADHQDGEAKVPIHGTQTDHTQDLVLAARSSTGGNDTYTLSGRVIDESSGQGLSGVVIQIESYGHHEDPKPMSEESGSSGGSDGTEPAPDYYRPPNTFQRITSGANGAFQAQVPAGEANVWAEHEGYQFLRGWFEVTSDRTLDIPMRPSSSSSATITGVVRSSSGEPIPGAQVNVNPDWDKECPNGECRPRPEPLAESPSSEGDGVRWSYEPRDDRYAWTEADREGRYTLSTSPGALIVNAWAQDHVNKQVPIELAAGETKTVDLTLREIPPTSVTVRGQVLDAVSGDPVPYANVNVENQQWGHWEGTRTDASGTFELSTKPGHTILSANAWRYYWAPCPGGDGEVVHATDEAGSTDERDAAVSSSSPAIRAPDCEQGERDHDYYTRVMTMTFSTGESRELTIELPRAPDPDAVLQGWVVNASSGEGIPDVRVNVHNEATGEWGEATTDEDGSFKVPVRAGYYTLRTWVRDGYFDAAMNTVIAPGETKTVSLELTPGERAYGGCCIAYAEDRGFAMASGGADGDDTSAAAEGTAGAPRPSGPAGDQSSLAGGTDAASSQAGAATFRGSGGGLGTYDPSQVGDSSTDAGAGASATPGPGLLAVAVGLVGAALVIGRSRRNA